MMRINFEEPDDRQDSHEDTIEQSHEPSQTSDIYNARKAAKNLFTEGSEDDADDFESYEGEDFSKRYSTSKHSMQEIDDDRPMTHDARPDVSEFRIPPSPTRDRERERRRGFDEGRRVPKARTATGKIPSAQDYAFVEDNDDEFTNFRRRYEKKSAAPKYQEDEHNERSGLGRRVRRKVADSDHLDDDELDIPGVEPYVQSGISAPIRGIATVLVSLFLMMMVFLIYRHNMMSNELAGVVVDAAQVSEYREELSYYRIQNERLRETIEALEQETLIPPALTENGTVVDGYNGYNGNYAYDSNGAANGYATQDAPAENGSAATNETPATNESATTNGTPATNGNATANGTPAQQPQQRIHVVAQGDTLASLAQRFYGSQTQSNIQRIMDANNITDANLISIGQRLVIP